MGDVAVEIAAIVTLATTGPSVGERYVPNGTLARACLPELDLLGMSVLERTRLRLQKAGVSSFRIISDNWRPATLSAPRPTSFPASWERAISEAVRDGAKVIFLVRLDVYTDLDYAKLLRFHLESGSGFTEVHSRNESLNVAVVNTDRLRQESGGYRRPLTSLLSEREKFLYTGYVKKLSRGRDLHELVQDGLNRRCGFAPIGTETGDGIWYGDRARVHSSATVSGPVFLGPGCRVAAGCSISAGSSVERHCHIDCATTVRDSVILQNTYVGVGLDVNRAIAIGGELLHLDRDVAVEVADSRVIGTMRGFRSLARGVQSRQWMEPPGTT